MTLYKLPAAKGADSLDTDVIRTIELEGITYDFRFRWNTRDESWTVICSKSGGNVIFSTKAQTGRLLNSPYKHRTDCPQGDLIIVDITEDNGRVDFDNFTISGRYRLFYNTST